MKITARWMVTGALMLLLSLFMACEFEGLQFGPDDDGYDIEVKPSIHGMGYETSGDGTYYTNFDIPRGKPYGVNVFIEGVNFGDNNYKGDTYLPEESYITISKGSWNTEAIITQWNPTQIYFIIPPDPNMTAGTATLIVHTEYGESDPFDFTIRSGYSTTKAADVVITPVAVCKNEIAWTGSNARVYRKPTNKSNRAMILVSLNWDGSYYDDNSMNTTYPGTYYMESGVNYTYFISLVGDDGDSDWVWTSVTAW